MTCLQFNFLCFVTCSCIVLVTKRRVNYFVCPVDLDRPNNCQTPGELAQRSVHAYRYDIAEQRTVHNNVQKASKLLAAGAVPAEPTEEAYSAPHAPSWRGGREIVASAPKTPPRTQPFERHTSQLTVEPGSLRVLLHH